MNWLKQLVSRRRLYGDLSEEIREHLEEKVEGLVRNGMSRKDAESAARREFGNVTLMEENARDVWRWPSIENLLHNGGHGEGSRWKATARRRGRSPPSASHSQTHGEPQTRRLSATCRSSLVLPPFLQGVPESLRRDRRKADGEKPIA